MPRAAGTLQKILFRKSLPKTRETPHRSSSQSSVAYSRTAGRPRQPNDNDGSNEGDRRLAVKDGAGAPRILLSNLHARLELKKKINPEKRSRAELNFF